MQVKIFEAEDMASGLKMVKKALGPDALILSTKTVRRGGKLGLVGKPILEITAAIDTVAEESAPVRSQARGYVERHSRPAGRRLATTVDNDDLSYAALWKQQPLERFPKKSSAPPVPGRARQPDNSKGTPSAPAGDQDLHQLIAGLSRQIAELKERQAAAPPEPDPPDTPPDDPALVLLQEKGIDPEICRLVCRLAGGPEVLPQTDEPARLHAGLLSGIGRLIKTRSIPEGQAGQQERISLIGPTGVGKTTTIAKIAANSLEAYKGKIGLITIDTYRIAAVEQLKVYGEIMQLPVEVVIRPDDMEAALDRLHDRALILIDTAGRSPRNDNELDDMTSFLKPELDISNHLLLAATSRETELHHTIEQFSRLPLSSLVFTKIDEAGTLGTLLNILYRHDLPVSAVTNGQRVPEDIVRPEPQDLARLILNDDPRSSDNG